jgi:hypothetical protein
LKPQKKQKKKHNQKTLEYVFWPHLS